jgi:hypothetical protein
MVEKGVHAVPTSRNCVLIFFLNTCLVGGGDCLKHFLINSTHFSLNKNSKISPSWVSY